MDSREYSKSNSAYIKPGETEPFTATITDVIDSVDFNKKPCFVIELNNEKKIQLKNYQAKELEDMFGYDTDKWLNKNVSIGIGETTYNETTFPKFVFTAADQSRQPQAETPPVPDTNPDTGLSF